MRLFVRSRFWCIHSTPPGVCQGWPPPRYLRQQVPGFFVMGDQPSRLGKGSMSGKEMGLGFGSGNTKSPAAFLRASRASGKSWLWCRRNVPSLLADLRVRVAPIKVFQDLGHDRSSESATQSNPLTLGERLGCNG